MDHLHDRNMQVQHRLTAQFTGGQLPDFVKSASSEDLNPPATAQASLFADPVHRALPIHSKAATFLSNLFFYGRKANGEAWTSAFSEKAAQERLSAAAKVWGISTEVSTLAGNIEKMSQIPALTDEDYALCVTYGKEQIRRFPVCNAEAVKLSAELLHEDRAHYPYSWRKAAALKILDKAAEFKAVLDPAALEYLVKASGLRPLPRREVSLSLTKRSCFFDNAEVKAGMNKLAAATADGRGDLEKLCFLIDDMDRSTGAHRLYERGLATPEEMFFGGLTVKQADDGSTITLKNGKAFPTEAIKKAGIEPMRVLSDETLKSVTANDHGDLDMAKVAEVLPTLPLDEARLLTRAFQAVGIQPATEKSAARNLGDFDLDGWTSFARKNSLGAPKPMVFSIAIPVRGNEKDGESAPTDTTASAAVPALPKNRLSTGVKKPKKTTIDGEQVVTGAVKALDKSTP